MSTDIESKLGSAPMDRESAFEDKDEAKRRTSSVGASVTVRVFRGDAEGGVDTQPPFSSAILHTEGC